MKRPFAHRRPVGPFTDITFSANSEPDQTPCEVAVKFKQHIADMIIATEFVDAEHATLFYKVDDEWNKTPYTMGQKREVDQSLLRTLQSNKIEKSDNHYFAHTHPTEPEIPPDMSLADVAVAVDNEDSQTMSLTRMSLNKVKAQSVWEHKSMSKNKKEEFEAMFNKLAFKQPENPEVLDDVLDFLKPHYRSCKTVISYPKDLESFTTLDI